MGGTLGDYVWCKTTTIRWGPIVMKYRVCGHLESDYTTSQYYRESVNQTWIVGHSGREVTHTCDHYCRCLNPPRFCWCRKHKRWHPFISPLGLVHWSWMEKFVQPVIRLEGWKELKEELLTHPDKIKIWVGRVHGRISPDLSEHELMVNMCAQGTLKPTLLPALWWNWKCVISGETKPMTNSQIESSTAFV